MLTLQRVKMLYKYNKLGGWREFHILVQRVEQAVKLSAEKYCSASIMLGKTTEITHDFEVVEG